ncbi:MAG: alginate lyase family protein [Candidatus Limnocylindria bacterium]
MRRRDALAEQGLEPYRTAVDALTTEAELAAKREPRPRNPLDARTRSFVTDTHDAYTLALAWAITGEERYARHSAQFIMSWVRGVAETKDTCEAGGGNDCAASLLISRSAPGFVFASDLLDGSGALSADEVGELEDWMRTLILPAASIRTNNWGDAGTFMRLAVAEFIGDEAAFDAAIEDWRRLMDLVEPDGEIPEETRRGSLGLLYTQGAISYKVASAAIAERRGIDLWDYEGANGGTLRDAIDTFVRYWADPDAWPWHDGRMNIPTVDPAWELIYQHWPTEPYAVMLGTERPFGTANPSAIIWTTLTHGEPIVSARPTESGAQPPDVPRKATGGSWSRSRSWS